MISRRSNLFSKRLWRVRAGRPVASRWHGSSGFLTCLLHRRERMDAPRGPVCRIPPRELSNLTPPCVGCWCKRQGATFRIGLALSRTEARPSPLVLNSSASCMHKRHVLVIGYIHPIRSGRGCMLFVVGGQPALLCPMAAVTTCMDP